MPRLSHKPYLLWSLVMLYSLGHIAPVAATLLDLSNVPLALSIRVRPNIVFLLDDGGSMDYEAMTRDAFNNGRFTGTQPDGTSPTGSGSVRHRDDNDDGRPDCAFASNGQTFNGYIYGELFAGNNYPGGGGQNCNIADDQEWRFRNNTFNPLYFDPTKTYRPWPGLRADGQPFRDVPITAAPDNPNDANSPTIDLTRANSKRSTSDRDGDGQPDGFRYYTWADNNQNGRFDDGEETEYLIKNANAATQQNFANWFSYHRRRMSEVKSIVGNVIAEAENIRVGLVTFHNSGGSNTAIRDVNSDPTTGVKNTLLRQLYSVSPNGNKTLRSSLRSVGQYFSCDTGNGLFNAGECPALSAADGGTCQQNFVVLLTDGPYDDSINTVGNKDGDRNTRFDGGAYADSWSNTAADIAMDFYERDLQPSLANNVPILPGVDEANHQHMVTYVMTFGATGALASNPPNNRDAFAWPNPDPGGPPTAASNAAKIDDMRHAAYNGRGLFFRTTNPDELTDALQRALEDIAIRTSSAAAVALNAGSRRTDSRVYQARYNSGTWNGQLLALPIQSDGSLGAPAWDAAVVLDGQHYDTGRQILTYNPSTGTGVPFRWGSLTAAQQLALHTNSTGVNDGQGQTRLNYLRGSTANEGTGLNYRTRQSRLGDLINSDPFYVGAPPFNDSLGNDYTSFRRTYSGRSPFLLVGGNDGMLHIFAAATGTELLAYVPNEVFNNLSQLTSPTYRHRYYVDGSPTVGDAYLNLHGQSEWRTVMVGGLRAGGQGYFALDVTDSSAFDESNASRLVLWEFTQADDPDLGATFSQPSIVLMANGKWAAVFGNGYNNLETDGRTSATGHAVLYIVFLEGGLDGTWTLGTDYIKIDTGVGDMLTPNGLATPAVIDLDRDLTADYITAGDLQGNVWVFDVRDPNPSNWKSEYRDGGRPVPLFIARDATGRRQPITTRAEIGEHPEGSPAEGYPGFVIYIGTGKYLEAGDITPANFTPQTFYAIWDKNEPSLTSFNRSDLLQQSVIAETMVDGQTVRVTSDNIIDWSRQRGWYIDLPASGERSVADAVLRNGRIIFTTLVPNSEICNYGGTSFVMELDVDGGRRLKGPLFDLNGDQKFTNDDKVSVTVNGQQLSVSPSGIASTEGILTSPSVLSSGTTELKYSSGSSGGINVITENPARTARGRQAWRQLY